MVTHAWEDHIYYVFLVDMESVELANVLVSMHLGNPGMNEEKTE